MIISGEPASIGYSIARNLREGGLDKFKGQGRRYARRDSHHRNNLGLGFVGVMSGPLVRSSYRAGRLYHQAVEARASQGVSAH